MTTDPELTDEQAAIYDRQIRVWGADVQKRLTSAKVLLMGCTPLAAEVAKNFVLAGVGQLTVVDDSSAASAALTFLTDTALANKGSSVATMYASGLQELNPMVAVHAAPGAASELPAVELLKDKQLVLAFGLHAGQQNRLNGLCREHKVQFIAARSRGGCAVAFLDLLEHQLKMPERSDGAKGDDFKVLQYQTISEAAQAPWTRLSAHDSRRLNPLLPAWAVISALEIQHNRAATSGDFEVLEEEGLQRQVKASCKHKLWDSAALKGLLATSGNVPAVDAIVGGFLGNDVVRALSHAGVPTHNVLCFSVADNVAQMHNLTGLPTVRAG